MKHLTLVLTSLFIALNISAQTDTKKVWALAWEDTFDSLNHSMWNIADYSDHYGEPQLYLKQNVSVTNGSLNLIVTSDSAICPQQPPQPISGVCGSCKQGMHPYTSGWIETKKDYATQFGYIEARIKMPYKSGYWPAFWTFQHSTKPINAGEIDIFEMLGYLPKNVITMNLHKEYPDHNIYFKKKKIHKFTYADWHNYGVYWTAKKMIWYVDGKKVYKVGGHGITDSVRIILNMAIDRGHSPQTTPTFADTMFVDYVKVYKKVPTNELYKKLDNGITRNENITPWRKPKKK